MGARGSGSSRPSLLVFFTSVRACSALRQSRNFQIVGFEQDSIEGRRFSRKESIEEGEVPAVREEAMDCEELMEEIRCGFEGTVDYPMLRVHHMICVLRRVSVSCFSASLYHSVEG